MNRRHIAHVAGLLALAVAVRAVLFEYAGIWGDWGFYVYNAGVLNEGQMPFVDFIARSPLLMQTYALVSPLGNQAYLFRAFVVAWWLLTALPVYLIAREIQEHRAGIASLCVYLFAPFAVTYGFWGNTQSMAAFLLMTALYVVVRRETYLTYGVFGVLVGMAFLARRSVVVVFGAIALYLLWQWYRSEIDFTAVFWRASMAYTAFALTLAVGYLWLAQWHVGRAMAFYEIHAVNLFFSSGRGGFPLLGTPPNPAVDVATTNKVPVIHSLCQRCGAWTARTFAKTLVLTTPIVGPLLYYCRDWVRRWFTTRDVQYLVGILGALALYAVIVAVQHGFYVRTLAVVAMALFAVFVYQSDRAPTSLLYHKHMVLLLCILLAFSAGYLYRARLLHTYYFMDFLPALSIVSGVLYSHMANHKTAVLRVVLALAVILAVVNTSAAAYPITNLVVNDNSGGWFTVDNVQQYGDDMDARTDGGEEVLAANPSYVALSHATMVGDNARLYYTLISYEDSGPAADIYEYLLPRLRNGSIEYVVYSPLVEEMLYFNQSVARAFDSHYCPVDTDGLYEQTDATLYQYNASC